MEDRLTRIIAVQSVSSKIQDTKTVLLSPTKWEATHIVAKQAADPVGPSTTALTNGKVVY